MDLKNLEDLDLYELLEIQTSSSVSEIKKAYRRKALECHPDKNPDNPNAAEEFRRLSKILEILTDEAARAVYDKVLKGRKEAALRHSELDSKRRKLKEDLEAREKQASGTYRKKTEEQELMEVIARLNKEGSRLVQEEMELVNRLAKKEVDSSTHRIKIKWKASKGDDTNGGYTKELLQKFLQKYGDIEGLVMSKKNGGAVVEFKNAKAAEMAVELEQGLLTNPLKCEWINGPPKKNPTQSNLLKDSDFESVVMMKLRQAEERKRLIAQMMAEDGETD